MICKTSMPRASARMGFTPGFGPSATLKPHVIARGQQRGSAADRPPCHLAIAYASPSGVAHCQPHFALSDSRDAIMHMSLNHRRTSYVHQSAVSEQAGIVLGQALLSVTGASQIVELGALNTPAEIACFWKYMQ